MSDRAAASAARAIVEAAVESYREHLAEQSGRAAVAAMLDQRDESAEEFCERAHPANTSLVQHCAALGASFCPICGAEWRER